MRKRRETSAFSLSFLDVMCCGFGAAILLVMILNGKTLQKRTEKQGDLQAEIERQEILMEHAEAHLRELQAAVEETELTEGQLRNRIQTIEQAIQAELQARSETEEEIFSREGEIDRLTREIQSLQASREELAAGDAESRTSNLIGFDGEGRRQYLTGLKLGGENTLILLDTSASMLDETIVNIVRRKLMPDTVKRRSPKWQRVVKSYRWILANIQPGKRFQTYAFSTSPVPLVEGTGGTWMDSGNEDHLRASLDSVMNLSPQGGTNLERAFEAIKSMSPRPDSVILITDGLPTLGSGVKQRGSVSGEDRLKLFENATKDMSTRIPINILLFPIEGDPAAAAAYWQLAVATDGSFITPARDWP
jgi:hypothetical protein